MAWHFDETSGQYVTLGDDAALTLPDGDWTIGGWIKLDDNAGIGFQYFLSWGAAFANPSINWLLREASQVTVGDRNRLEIIMGDGDTTAIDIIGTSTPGTSTAWQHFALRRSGSTITQYVNGLLDGTAIDAAFDAVDVAANLFLGMREDNNPDRRLGGSMAEWAKWDRALSTDELLGLAAGWTPDAFPAPVWQLPMFGGEYSEMRVPLTVTNTGSTAADHPGGLIYPSGALVVSAAVVAVGNRRRRMMFFGAGAPA